MINNDKDKVWIGSHGLTLAEVDEILGEGEDLGSLCKSDNINPFARWKPFRVQNVTEFSSFGTQMNAMLIANMGFSIPLVTLNSRSINNPVWEYLKPRGAAYNEWFRKTDFAPLGGTDSTKYGYYHYADYPLSADWPDSVNNMSSLVFELRVDTASRESGDGWDPDESVSIFECVGGGNNNYSTYVFALLIVDNDGPSRALVSSGLSVSDVGQSSHNKIIQLSCCSYYAPAAVQEQNVGSVLPQGVFADTEIGHTYDFAWVLADPTAFSGSSRVNNLSTVPPMRSLCMEDDAYGGVNFRNLELKRLDTIDGLTGYITCDLTRILSGGNPVTDSYSSTVYHLFRIDNLRVYLDITNTEWKTINTSTGLVTDRSVVYVEIGPIAGVSSANIYVMPTTTSSQSLATNNYNEIRPSVIDPGSSTYRTYEPTALNCLFDVAKGSTPKTETILLNDPSNTGTGSELPYIYIWVREDDLSDGGVSLSGIAYSDRTKVTQPYEGIEESVILTSKDVYIDE